FDIISFFTPSSIKSFFHHVKNFKQGKLIIGTFGENTNTHALNANLNVSISAPNELQKNMCDALDCFLKNNLIE
ncbi:MAG: uroporphyrinogen-III synthase, partial [Sediminibacterium sp.]|nr:uroporphyrinogen-III synthase [Sediminibacterium sp.]